METKHFVCVNMYLRLFEDFYSSKQYSDILTRYKHEMQRHC